ncbi:MAG: NAD-dependent epimerase/dehydratase family protein [Deltaproteobacteria bacterium]|nr:NAD-dependent epimerase/dehydratase family protein [Deltaproteobacteria bacterium]MDD9853248.1 NAD-dependent epimerase/dehydratase family protein [Deltaproteobacteria bacterium]
MARIVLAGAAGFIALRTAQQLLARGDEVFGLDDLNDFNREIKLRRLAGLRGAAGFRFAEVDVAERAALRAAVPGESFDAVINLAAQAGVRASVADPWRFLRANVAGNLNLLELCSERGIGKFVLASTSSLYGRGEAPFREEQAIHPLSPYAASKGAAEHFAHTWHALHGLDVTVLRYFTVYGPSGRPDMAVFRFVQGIREGRPIMVFGDGSMSRDFTYVDDVARGTVSALRPLGYAVVNLGGDSPHKLRELIALVERHTGRRAEIETRPPHPADPQRTAACIDRARSLLDWSPEVGLEEGIRRTAEWYEANRSWAKDLPTG